MRQGEEEKERGNAEMRGGGNRGGKGYIEKEEEMEEKVSEKGEVIRH